MTELDMLVRFFKAMGDATRLELVRLLARGTGGQALCVGRLAHELGVTPSGVSQHLRILKDLGLVQSERRGYQVHYWLDARRLDVYRALARAQLGSTFTEFIPTFADKEDDEMAGCHGTRGCEHPERLEGTPGDCSPEQVRECHGDAQEHPCATEGETAGGCGCGCGCQQPEHGHGSPEECSAEQIRQCHGDVAEHPCAARAADSR